MPAADLPLHEDERSDREDDALARPAAADRPFRWGIVGFGWVARDFALPAMLDAGHECLAVHDPGPDAVARAAALDLRSHAQLAALLAEPELDAVYVATPNHAHAGAVAACAAAGIPALCEKPMAATLDQAERMADAVRRAGIPYGTAFDQRHHPVHAALRDAVSAGDIGTVTTLRLNYCCWLGADWAPVDGAPNWRIDQAAAGGGALMDLAPHGLDLCEYLLGEPIEAVRALTQSRVQSYAVPGVIDDGAVLLGRTASGVLVSLHVSYNHPETLPRRRLELVGDAGLLVAENSMGQDPGGTATLRAAANGIPRPLPVPDAHRSPFSRQMDAFARAVRGRPLAAAGRDFSLERDLHTMRLLRDAYRDAGCP